MSEADYIVKEKRGKSKGYFCEKASLHKTGKWCNIESEASLSKGL